MIKIHNTKMLTTKPPTRRDLFLLIDDDQYPLRLNRSSEIAIENLRRAIKKKNYKYFVKFNVNFWPRKKSFFMIYEIDQNNEFKFLFDEIKENQKQTIEHKFDYYSQIIEDEELCNFMNMKIALNKFWEVDDHTKIFILDRCSEQSKYFRNQFYKLIFYDLLTKNPNKIFKTK